MATLSASNFWFTTVAEGGVIFLSPIVIVAGLPVNDPFGGWVYWRALSALGIDRIEIVPSGASALFGNFALGGVLHVISRPIEGRSADAIAAVGSLGTQRAAARATDRFGEIGVALDGEALLANLRARMANFKVPKALFVAAELPRNAMGKVQKNVLRDRYGKEGV